MKNQRPDEIAVPTDLLRTSSATGIAHRMMPDTSWGSFAANLARRPGRVAGRVGSVGRELVWRYWVNNYLQGRLPAPFDVLFWNADTTRMPAALHRDMVRLGMNNALTEPGGVTMLDTPVDLGTVTADTYVVAGIADHISPWQACYRSARLLGSKDLRFVLSTSGHIAALVNPPGNPKASYRVSSAKERDPDGWIAAAEQYTGSWWPEYSGWLAERSSGQKRARKNLGNKEFSPTEPASGTYVHDR